MSWSAVIPTTTFKIRTSSSRMTIPGAFVVTVNTNEQSKNTADQSLVIIVISSGMPDEVSGNPSQDAGSSFILHFSRGNLSSALSPRIACEQGGARRNKNMQIA